MNSQIVGFSKWDYPHPPSPGKKDRKPWYDVEGANLDLCEEFYGAIDRYKEAAVNPETDFRESFYICLALSFDSSISIPISFSISSTSL